MVLYLIILLIISTGIIATDLVADDDDDDSPLNLTPLIERGDSSIARILSIVEPSLFADVPSHAAYITANQTKEWNLFFWFFPAQNKPLNTTPWIIWLQGGPGASSLAGLFDEIGPITITKELKVKKMPVTWGSDYSLLFIDNPVGAGFSYSGSGIEVKNENEVGDTLLCFLEQFLQVFPELQNAPLFIAGESYAGKYIPAFGHYIHARENTTIPINLRGLAIGDGWIDPPSLTHVSDWGIGTGFLDFKQAEEVKLHEIAARKYWKEGRINEYNREVKLAFSYLSLPFLDVYNYMSAFMPKKPDRLFGKFVELPMVRKALHVGHKKFNGMSSNRQLYMGLTPKKKMLEDDIFLSVRPWLEELVENYGVMCYSGQLDIIVAYSLSIHMYKNLKWSGQNEYLKAVRIPIMGPTPNDEDSVIAFEKSYKNFMDVLVIGAGHMVPKDQPRSAKIIIDKFIKKFK